MAAAAPVVVDPDLECSGSAVVGLDRLAETSSAEKGTEELALPPFSLLPGVDLEPKRRLPLPPPKKKPALEVLLEVDDESPFKPPAPKTGPLSTDSSVGGGRAATAKPLPIHFLRLRRMKRARIAAMRRKPRTLPITMPAMVPGGSFLEEEEEFRGELGSAGGMVMMFGVAPWFQTQEETLNVLRS